MQENKKAVLVVSFGTSYQDTREKSIGAIEKEIAGAFEGCGFFRAYTSQMVINKLKSRDGLEVDNVTQAAEKIVKAGYSLLTVQPTHVMNGIEYDKMRAALKPYEGAFVRISYGKPLLTSTEDFRKAAKSLMEEIPEQRDGNTAVVFMGHGTGHFANAAYCELEYMFRSLGYQNVFVGTVESFPGLSDVMSQVNNYGARKVVLYPFMVAAGDHARNDMAGEEEDSWKNQLIKAGYEVDCVIKGLGEYKAVRDLFVVHAKAAEQE
ncbi:sirohydrochlorin cobaltochelatase [Anaerolentibacter hominis]|uniref:sirohydrochlorin cobaltochelatase n=1 Tax=Anaerolentibacter hominis TaxID=3079009 RepID=UPI0031B80079